MSEIVTLTGSLLVKLACPRICELDLMNYSTGRLQFREAYGYRNPRGIADQNKKL